MDKIYEIVDHHLIFRVNGRVVDVDLRQLIWPCSALSIFYLLFWRESGFQDMEKVAKKTCQLVDKPNENDVPYTPKPVNIPALKGWLSVLYKKLLRSPFGRTVLMNSSKQQGELDMFLKLDLPDQPTFHPVVFPDKYENEHKPIDLWSLLKPSDTTKSFHFNTISDYVEAYRSGLVTPLEVAKNVIQAIKASEGHSPKLRIIIEFHEDDILNRATESTERWNSNKPLSVFDGIPVAVKDEIYLAGYPCRAGLPLQHLSKIKSLSDEGLMVEKLREAGAIFIGMANMHQLGIGITGINPSKYHGTCRNPYNIDHPPGGSSSGPAAAVACGLCPIALCADGGGSIRIPASVNGIVGAKASFGRISGTGFHPNCDTVAHAGAVCATARDAAIFYGAVAGRDDACPEGLVQPPPTVDNFERTDLNGITIGVDWNFFNDCVPEIAEACKKGIEYMVESCGAKVIEISIPELQETARAHVVTTLTEMYTYGKEIYHKHHHELNTDTEINLAIGSTFVSSEYFLAQKQRTRSMNILKRLFKQVDCIATPVCGDFMPKLNAENLEYGFSDLQHLTSIIRYCVLGNLAGHPSISVPVGYSSQDGLPIGLLLQTSWWQEDLMFCLAHVMEGFCELKKPQIYYDLLSKVVDRENGTNSPSSSSPMLS